MPTGCDLSDLMGAGSRPSRVVSNWDSEAFVSPCALNSPFSLFAPFSITPLGPQFPPPPPPPTSSPPKQQPNYYLGHQLTAQDYASRQRPHLI
ncbi:hypothetical protein M747DRAFT_294177 [Aspergillus niger ATCC 13496]|uniref:Uncharacterized protein n=1 Tax=Aspergillus niger ATCC 13496 TaxID=1353008 RepID=A0A370C6F0_ASPNG|nr:hypothetical protein M747DRAFT_294177 [Aspergillus niger ATCC 13496]